MIEHNFRKNVLVTLFGYLAYLVILTFFERPINYDFTQCNNSTNTTNTVNNNTNTNTNTTDLCSCEDILYQIDIFNITTIFFGFISCILLLIVFGYMLHRQKIINVSIVITMIYIFIVEVMGLPVLIRTITTDCSNKIYEFDHLYFFGFVSHIVLVFIFALVILVERTRLETVIDCSICVTRPNRQNRRNNEDLESVGIMTEDKPPPYYQ